MRIPYHDERASVFADRGRLLANRCHKIRNDWTQIYVELKKQHSGESVFISDEHYMVLVKG